MVKSTHWKRIHSFTLQLYRECCQCSPCTSNLGLQVNITSSKIQWLFRKHIYILSRSKCKFHAQGLLYPSGKMMSVSKNSWVRGDWLCIFNVIKLCDVVVSLMYSSTVQKSWVTIIFSRKMGKQVLLFIQTLYKHNWKYSLWGQNGVCISLQA